MASSRSGKKSSWDINTPRDRRGDRDGRTPKPTPAHRYNKWADDRKKSGITPAKGARSDGEEDEEELARLDREWYSMDDGFDESNNSFATMSDDFVSRKSESLKQKWKKKVSFHQQQKNKVII